MDNELKWTHKQLKAYTKFHIGVGITKPEMLRAIKKEGERREFPRIHTLLDNLSTSRKEVVERYYKRLIESDNRDSFWENI